MKKFLLFAGLAAATLSFAGCNKEADVKGLDGVPYEIVLSDASTRTVNSGMTTKWVEGDALSVFYAPAGQTEYAVAQFDVTDPDQNLAVGEVELTADAYDWYLFYPYDSHLKTPANTNSGYMTVGGLNQTQKGNDSMAHLAGKNLPVVGVAKNVAVDQKPVVSMKHVSSVVAVNLTNDTDKPLTVSSVSFTAPEDVVGTYYIDFSGEKVAFKSSGDNYVSASVTLSVEDAEAIAPGASAKFYMAVKPFTANVDSELKLVVLADQGEVEKTVTLTQAYTFGGGSIKTLNLSYEAPAVVPTITVADINEAITSTQQSSPSEFTGQLAGATVSFVSGNSAFIQDETAGILLYMSGHGLKAGDVLSGLVSGKGWIRYGVRQLTSLTGFDKASGEAPAALELSLADLLADYDRYVSVRVKLSDVEVTDAITTSDRNGAIKDGESELNLYAQVTNTLDVPLGVYDMVGYPTYYNTTKQLGLWAQDDIVAQDAPFFNAAAEQTEVSATTTSVKINVSGNVAWTAEASDGATLDKESGEGEGVITVSFAENKDTENPKEYTVFVRTDEPSLVAAGTEEFEINITQAKADAAGTTSVTIDFSEQGFENGAEVTEVSESGVKATFDKGTGANAPKYYTTGTAVRAYGGNTLTVTADGKTIVSIELTFSSGEGSNAITTDVPTYAEPTWTGEAGSVTFTVGGTSGHRRIKAITVKYSGDAAPAATLESIAVSGQKTAFNVGDTFVFDGKVTATYSDGSTKEVQPTEVSKPDMSTAGTKEVTVTYKEGEKTATAKYEITVSEVDTSLHTIVIEDYASTTFTAGVYTVTAAKAEEGTAPAYNATGKDLRVYANGTLTVSNSKENITKIVFNLSSQGLKRLAPITASTGTIENQAEGDTKVTWTGDAREVVFTVGAHADYGSDGSEKAGQLDFTSMDVAPWSDGDVQPKTLASLEVSGQKTAFTVGDEFSFNGTATAVYSDGSRTVVTDDVTFSGYDMSTAGEQVVTVKYQTVSTTYNITVSEAHVPEEGVDVLNQAFTGITGSNYTEFSGKTGKSGAVYAGQCAGGNESIQLRSNNNNSGIITTGSGGKVKKVVVVWNANTASGRTLNIYGKNTAYSAATDLYSADNQGELLGTIVYGTSTELSIEGDYEFIGFRSASGAMYLTEVDITWE